MLHRDLLRGTTKGLSLIFAYVMVEPLHIEIVDTFGSAFVYHPAAVWLTLFCLVWANTDSIQAGVCVILVYELTKRLWRMFKPEPPYVCKLRKLVHRIDSKDRLSDSDVKFLNEVTPDEIVVTRKFSEKNGFI